MSRLKKNIRNYTQVANDIINDDRLSLKAKGLYLFLVSKPDNWTFSARLISTQNKDSIDGINSTLQELERFGLLIRVHVQGGYDYEIFDEIKIHSRENPLNGKTTTKQNGKIHLMEKPLNISNKESKAKREERENNNVPKSLPDYEIMINDLNFTSSVQNFLDELCKSKAIKNRLSYRSKILNSLSDTTDKNHSRTVLAYNDFMTRYCPAPALPVGVNIFDLIGRV